jgi:hypothetical protein
MVKQAIENGFLNDINKLDVQASPFTADYSYTTILNFLLSIENNLAEHINKIKETPQVDNQENYDCAQGEVPVADIKTLWLTNRQVKNMLSVQQRKKLEEQKSLEGVAAILFEQILKNWKPTKKEPLN